jgi:hypothetical protein
LAILLLLNATLNAAVVKIDDTPEQAAKSFYTWYLRELNRENIRIDKKQMLKYVSKRLGKWYVSPAYEGYGADYFIDAQDFDENWQPTTTKAVVKGNIATLKVMLAPPKGKKSNFNQTLAVKMVLENGAWKIDSVNNRKLIVE